jgi:hypothetical protein
MLEVGMFLEHHLRPIIQPGPADRPIVQTKTSDPNDMKRHRSGGAETRNIAGVRWDLRFD